MPDSKRPPKGLQTNSQFESDLWKRFEWKKIPNERALKESLKNVNELTKLKQEVKRHKLPPGAPKNIILKKGVDELTKLKQEVKDLRQELVNFHNVLRDYKTHLTNQNKLIEELRNHTVVEVDRWS